MFPLLQLIASSIFAASSAVVAILAYRMTRANTLGLQPIIIVQNWDHECYDHEGISASLITFHMEVWNRRKYPITIRDVTIIPDSFRFDEAAGRDFYPPEDSLGSISETVAHLPQSRNVKASEKEDIPLNIPIVDRPGPLRGVVHFEVKYYDPIKRRNVVARTIHMFGEPISMLQSAVDFIRGRQREKA